ncbi:hypothetical protein [Oligoflexus tunisiensis]|uniref:hypothetical protein n=1 Tax=Oligoflexus tunisiensis TaxID=708132 RepID=UPI00114CDDE2|nr:hypothetical protein [Oligoflexus tunisiensis]
MKNAVACLLCFLLMACSNSNFSGRSESDSPSNGDAKSETAPAATPQENKADPEALPTVESQPIATDSAEYKECLLAVGGDAQSVVTVTQGDVDLSQLTPNSILYLVVRGQAKIDLTAQEITTLKGVCIDAAGQAELTLDLNATVSALFYYARGDASTSLNFKETGSLLKLLTDVSGQSRLSLSGQKLVCGALQFQKAGASTVECNGVKL